MIDFDVVEKQNEIIRLQSNIITDLCAELAQHAELDRIEAELARIEALKEEINHAGAN